MPYWKRDCWEVKSRGRENQCVKQGIASVGERWKEESRGATARGIPYDFALHSGRIWRAIRLPARSVLEVFKMKEGRGSSSSFVVYVRAPWTTRSGCQRWYCTVQETRSGGLGYVLLFPILQRPLGKLLLEHQRPVQISGRREVGKTRSRERRLLTSE